MSEKNDKRILYLDLLRVFSVFSMILLHMSASNWYSTPVSSFNWQVFNVYDSLVRFCVPVFFMISGALFLDNSKNVTLKKICTKNIPRLVTAFISWSFCYAIFSTWIYKLPFNMIDFIKRVIWGHYHLWFIYTLIFLYLIVPFLKVITADKKLTEYFLLLSFIFCICVNFLNADPRFAEFYGIISGKMQFLFISGYSGYFVLGFYLHKYEFSKKTNNILYMLAVVSLIFTVFVTIINSVNRGEPYEYYFNYLLTNTYFVSIGVFLFFKNHYMNASIRPSFQKLLITVSNLSFGIFLVHDFFNVILTKIGLTTLSYNAILSVPLNSILVFLLSLSVSYIISKIPIVNKWII